MPTIPQAQYPSAQSRPVGTPYQRTDASTGGHELAQGLNQLGAGVADVGAAYERGKERARQVDVNNGLAGLTRDADNGYYGAPDAMKTGESVPGVWGLDVSGDEGAIAAPNGLAGLKGKDAAKGSEQYVAFLDKRRQEHAEQIEDLQAREEFLARSAQLVNDYRRKAEVHTGEQMAEAEKASQAAIVNSSLQAINASYSDEDAVETQFELAAGALRKGALSKEDGDGKVLALQQAIAHVRVNQYLTAGDYKGAEEVFKKSRAVLDEKSGAQLGKAIEDRKFDVEAEKTARHIIEIARPDDGGPVDENQALEAVNAIPPGPERDKVRGLVEHYANVAGGEWKNTIDKRYSGAFTTYLKASAKAPVDPRAAVPKAEQDWLIDHAPEKWDALLDKYEQDKARARRAGRGAGAGSSAAERVNLIKLKADLEENPGKYSEMTAEDFLSEWGTKLAPSDLDTAGTLFAAKKKEPKESASEFSRYLADRVSESPVFQRQESKSAQIEAVNAASQYRAFMGDMRRKFIDKNKREPMYDELEEMNKRATADVIIKGKLWGSSTVPAYAAPPELRPKEEPPLAMDVAVKNALNAVPAADRALIADGLRKRGRAVTPEAIIAAYTRKHGLR